MKLHSGASNGPGWHVSATQLHHSTGLPSDQPSWNLELSPVWAPTECQGGLWLSVLLILSLFCAEGEKREDGVISFIISQIHTAKKRFRAVP